MYLLPPFKFQNSMIYSVFLLSFFFYFLNWGIIWFVFLYLLCWPPSKCLSIQEFVFHFGETYFKNNFLKTVFCVSPSSWILNFWNSSIKFPIFLPLIFHLFSLLLSQGVLCVLGVLCFFASFFVSCWRLSFSLQSLVIFWCLIIFKNESLKSWRWVSNMVIG